MKLQGRLISTALLGIAALLAACDDTTDSAAASGAVFAMTNAADNNQILGYQRTATGALTLMGQFSTGGRGSGPNPIAPAAPLGAQDPIVLSDDNRYLFAVNAGSNEISTMRVLDNGTASLVGKAASGGMFPISIAVNDELLYVLNAGGAGNISGFRVGDDGLLTAIPGSTQPLSGTDTPLPDDSVLPGTIDISPDGRFIAVTEKATNLIDIFLLDDNGVASAPIAQPTDVPTPFGAEFDLNGFFIVSDANVDPGTGMPTADDSSVSSYSVGADGTLTAITTGVTTLETAACWIEITANNQFAYTTNTNSGTVTGFQLDGDGVLTSLNPADGVTAALAPTSILLEMAIADEYLYVLAAGSGEINGFAIAGDGSLTPVEGGTVGGLPGATAEGLAAF